MSGLSLKSLPFTRDGFSSIITSIDPWRHTISWIDVPTVLSKLGITDAVKVWWNGFWREGPLGLEAAMKSSEEPPSHVRSLYENPIIIDTDKKWRLEQLDSPSSESEYGKQSNSRKAPKIG